MKTLIASVVLTLCLCLSASAQLDQVLKEADQALEHRDTSNLSDTKIISGLKEALQFSTSRAVAATGKPDGFLKNEAIKIVLPPKLETIGNGMRMLGMGSKVDELEVGMNRAAEQATPQAKAIFLASLKKMTFDDAHILTGNVLLRPTISSAPVPPTSRRPSLRLSINPWTCRCSRPIR